MYAREGIGQSIGAPRSPRGHAAWETGRTIEALRCVADHFAVAASQMAAEEGIAPGDAARLREAEALFRAQAADCGLRCQGARRVPFVRLENGESTPLTVLLACADDRRLGSLTLRSIDEDLVLISRRMLGGLKWYLPDEE